jgi:hypothetical protein
MPLLLLAAALIGLLFPSRIPAAETDDRTIPLHVAAGTNLIHLARDYCHSRDDWREIARINRLAPPYLIVRDTTLQVPLARLVAEPLTARVAAVNGTVSLLSGDDQATPLHKDNTVAAGQTVVTGPDGYAHLILPDNTYTRVDPDSHLRVVYLFRLADGNVKADLELRKGDIMHWMRQKLRPNDSFRTRTPIAVTGIRGTEYRLKTANDGGNSVETLSGRVEVTAANRTITVNPDKGTRIRKGAPPEPPRLLPAPPQDYVVEPLYRALPVRITAPDHRKARTIHLRITADEQGQQTVFEQDAAPGGAFTVATLPDGTYSAFLTAIDADQFESRPAGPLPLTIRTNPPAPMITSPNNDGILWGKHGRIEWLASNQATHYKLQLANDPDFRDLIDEREVTAAEYLSPELQPGTYYFRVQSVAADGYTTLFSTPVAWKQKAEMSMGGMEATANNKPVLQWPAMADGWSYDLQVADDEAFTQLIVDQKGLASTSYTMEQKLDPGTYHVRLRGVVQGEPATPWTPTQTMTVKRKPLGWEELVIGLTLIGILIL